MQISVKRMVIGGPPEPAQSVEATLKQFFIDDIQIYQDPIEYPLTHQHTHYREGGCQFSFNREATAPLLCIDCHESNCKCSTSLRNRYALQRFTQTHIYILDIDLNDNRPRDYGVFSKYHALRYDEERSLREMEVRMMGLSNIAFFYRTKCNGFRVGFETAIPIVNVEKYEKLCVSAEAEFQKLLDQLPDNAKHPWFHVDYIGPRERPFRSYAYWSYPRVHNPVWLNPERKLP